MGPFGSCRSHSRCHIRAAARRRRDPERGPPAAGARGFAS